MNRYPSESVARMDQQFAESPWERRERLNAKRFYWKLVDSSGCSLMTPLGREHLFPSREAAVIERDRKHSGEGCVIYVPRVTTIPYPVAQATATDQQTTDDAPL